MSNLEGQMHQPVLLTETLELLQVTPGESYIDATLGGGGHTNEILKRGGKVLGIDADPEAVALARQRLDSQHGSQFSGVVGNFRDLESIARDHDFTTVAGVLYDLGLSRWQIEQSGRGFSYLKNEPLDMRQDLTLAVRAEDLLKVLTEKELHELFSKFAEEQRSRAIARALVGARNVRPLAATQELSGLLAWVERRRGDRFDEDGEDFWRWYEEEFAGDPNKYGDYDRRARIFQALRITVNDDINNLAISLPQAARLLKTHGRLVIISFHSLEDRIVRDFGEQFRSGDEGGRPWFDCVLQPLCRRPVTPAAEEIAANPRARSARLRAFERVG